MALSYIGIGSNLGERAQCVRGALQALAEVGEVRARSSLYESAPWGKRDQPSFVNAVALVDTTLDPFALLAALQVLERRFGREPSERWGPRALDLDLLTYDDVRMERDVLRLPHRYLFERAFVLVPLAEIDAGYAPARDALSKSDLEGVVLYCEPEGA